MSMKDIDEATRWYEQNQSLFESLANKVADILKENVEEKQVQYHSISFRRKSLESFTAKAKKDKYADPANQIMDIAGVRVITYLETDVSRIAEIIEGLFDVDLANSLDQSKLLGSDRLGYRSVHYVAKFDKNRCKLPEYKRYKGLPFEIQIRSLLQHAWAEIEHDRNYKFSGKLPTELERRFYLIAGALEIADHEFVAIATEIDKYKNEVKQDLMRGDLDIEITTASLTEYLSNRFSKLAKNIPRERIYGRPSKSEELGKLIVEELELFGIKKLEQLDKVIPKSFEDDYLAIVPAPTFLGIVRDILIISDFKRYFEVSWRQSWTGMKASGAKLLAKYGVDMNYLKKHDISITPEPIDADKR